MDWSVDPEALLSHAGVVAERALARLHEDGIDDLGVAPLFQGTARPSAELLTLPPDRLGLLLKNSISPLPLHKTLALLDTLEQHRDEAVRGHERLALATALVSGIGNLHFGPEVGVGRIQEDAPVVDPWLERVRRMADDLAALRAQADTAATVHLADSREAEARLEPSSIDAVITSPPYPNEKDYTRTTRLESVLLGLVRSRQELRGLKQGLVRSNTRSVYKADTDDALVAEHEGIQRIARRIEERRIELGKTSGFERQYARVTKLYFGGMVRHLAGRRSRLRPGARLAYVVGDQASYLRVMIRHREDPRRACPAPRLRADCNRPVPDADRHGQPPAATGGSRPAPLARRRTLCGSRLTMNMARTALIVGAGIGGLSGRHLPPQVGLERPCVRARRIGARARLRAARRPERDGGSGGAGCRRRRAGSRDRARRGARRGGWTAPS